METQNTKQQYRIVILGANGGIGRQSVEIALKAGHTVTAIVRNPASLNLQHAHLKIVKGDVMDPENLEKHFKNQDAVISAIGKNSFKPNSLYSQGNKNVLSAMKNAGVSRGFFISASGLVVNPSHNFIVRFATKFILQKLLRHMYADLESMEALIKQSEINWTIMRPPRLTNDALTGKYRFSTQRLLNNGLKISRADVAHYMINNIGNTAIYKKTVELAY